MYCSSCGATVEDAITVLKRARRQVDEGCSDIDIALRELYDAETNIRRAIRELPEE